MDALAIFKALSNPTRLQIMEWLKYPSRFFDENSYTQQGLGFGVGICVGDIQRRSGLAQSVMSAYLQAMKEAGLLDRFPDPQDRRRVLVHLTEEGRKRMDAFVQRQAARLGLTLD